MEKRFKSFKDIDAGRGDAWVFSDKDDPYDEIAEELMRNAGFGSNIIESVVTQEIAGRVSWVKKHGEAIIATTVGSLGTLALTLIGLYIGIKIRESNIQELSE